MALVKPKLGDDVLQTDIDQTEAINKNDTDIGNIEPIVTEHNTKIMQLLNWMGLVKDYVVETGSNANGSYEKWNSGKLVQKGRTTGRTSGSGYLSDRTPTHFKNGTIKKSFSNVYGYSGRLLTANIFIGLEQTDLIEIYVKEGSTVKANTDVDVDWLVIGRW